MLSFLKLTKIRSKREGSSNTSKSTVDKSPDEVRKENSEKVPSNGSFKQAESSVSIHWTSQPADKPDVHGFEDEIVALKKILKRRENDNDNQFKAMGVVGTRGIGKTTLCQEFFNLLGSPEENDKKLFLPRIWVSMSSEPNDKDANKTTTVKKILDNLGVEVDNIISDSTTKTPDEVLKELLYALRLQLMGKRYLIVLDDVTVFTDAVPLGRNQISVMVGTTLADGLPKGYGGTVIVTGRSCDIVKKMVGDDRNVHCLLPLSDPDSLWSIFQDAIKKDVIDNGPDDKFNWEEEFKNLLKVVSYEDALSGKKIDVKEVLKQKLIRKCNGIPLAAKLMAKTMSEQILKKPKKDQEEAAKNEEVGSKKEKEEEAKKEDVGIKEEESKSEENGLKKEEEAKREEVGTKKEEEAKREEVGTKKEEEAKNEEIGRNKEEEAKKEEVGTKKEEEAKNEEIGRNKEEEAKKEVGTKNEEAKNEEAGQKKDEDPQKEEVGQKTQEKTQKEEEIKKPQQ